MNHRPAISKLLRTLQDHNFELVSVDDDGEEHELDGTPRTRRQEAKRIICSTGVSHLYMTHPSYPLHLWMMLIPDNGPAEMIADYTDWITLNLALEQYERKTLK